MSTTNEEYHNDVTRIGKSGLDLIAKSPAHYWARYLDPARLPDEPTAAMRLGTAVHHAILEPDEFSRRYKVLPELNLRATADKMKFQELQQNAIANNWTLVSAEDYALCKSIRDSVRRHRLASYRRLSTPRMFAGFRGRFSVRVPTFPLGRDRLPLHTVASSRRL